MDITVYLTAPVFLVPESVFYPDRPCLIIDTGSISLNSYLVPYTKEANYKAVTNPKVIYDRYVIGLSNFKVSILDEGLPNGIKDFKRGYGTPAI